MARPLRRRARPGVAHPSQASTKCSSRTERAMLASNGERIPPWGVPVIVSLSTPSSARMPAWRNAFTRRQDALVPDPTSHPVHKGRVVDLVEACRDVPFQHPLIGAGTEEVDLGDRVLRPALRAEAVAARLEVRLEDRLEHQLEGGLHHPVPHGRDAETAALSPPALGIIRSRTGRGRKLPSLQIGSQIVEEVLDAPPAST